MKHSLKDIAALVAGRVVGDAEFEVSGLAQLSDASGEDLAFVEDGKYLSAALRSQAGALIVGEFAASAPAAKPLIIVKNPKLAFARAATIVTPPHRHEPGVHSTALLHHSVKLGKLVAVQPNVVLTEGVVVGDRTRIGPGTAVGIDVHIGANCNIAANVTIYPGVSIGDHVIIHSGTVLGGDGFGFVRDPDTGAYEKFPQVGTLEIGDDVEIGCNCTIDRGALGRTAIGSGTKLDNMVHIAHNCSIGRNVVIAAQTGISGSCVVEDDVIIGGQVGIGDHCRIEQGVILASKCGVPTKKILRGKGVIYWGIPARPLKNCLKELAVLSKLAKEEK